ncbi:MAG: hypothetical protein ACLFWD_12005, partial [Anaerolineales bacterium]
MTISRWKWALYVFLLIKLALVMVTFRTPDGGVLVDSKSYLDLAHAWQTQGAYIDPTGDNRDLVRPPGYPAMIRLAGMLFGNGTWPITMLQLVFLSSISLFLIQIGLLIERPSLGLLAAW